MSIALHLGYVDLVILLVGADEPHVQNAVRIVRADDQAVLVAGDVENYPAVRHDAGATVCRLYVCRARPIGARGLAKPGLERLLGVTPIATFPALPQRPSRNNPHA